MPDDSTALLELRALLEVPDALRLITNEHACGAGVHPDIPPFDAEVCARYEFPLTDPRHFVIHSVVAIEGPNHKGQITASTAEGDYCTGQPSAVLARLQEGV